MKVAAGTPRRRRTRRRRPSLSLHKTYQRTRAHHMAATSDVNFGAAGRDKALALGYTLPRNASARSAIDTGAAASPAIGRCDCKYHGYILYILRNNNTRVKFSTFVACLLTHNAPSRGALRRDNACHLALA